MNLTHMNKNSKSENGKMLMCTCLELMEGVFTLNILHLFFTRQVHPCYRRRWLMTWRCTWAAADGAESKLGRPDGTVCRAPLF